MTRDVNAAEVVEEKKKKKKKEEECDDWCFVCKDGGDLMLCDFKDCPKVYHESCIDKDIAKIDGDYLFCMRHKCYLCKKRPKLYCLCCSHAVCQGCVTHSEFIRVKGNKGLCNQCQEVVFVLEEIQENDAAGDKIDLKDRDTVECLFLEYWTIVKNQEHITFDDVRASLSKNKDVKLSSEYRVRAMTRDMNAAEVVELEEEEEEEEEEKECDDWCFVCKDGGDLMLCDYKDCPKVYHERCIDKGIAKMDGDSLICMWHKCYLCKKKPKLQCLCCSHAVCQGCVSHAEFIRVKGNKGLCNECQELVFALEEIREYDAAGDKIDLADRNTVECLFLEYWTIVKNQEDITFDDVRASRSQKKDVKLSYKGFAKFSLRDLRTSRKGVKLENDDDPEFSLSDNEVEVVEDYKTLGKTKGMKFIGWGSKPLIDFLTSIGEDTKEALSQEFVESVIRKYIRQKNLYDQEKKRKINCDEQLYSIFKKKSVNLNRIHNLLNAHFKENLDQWEDMRRLARGFSEEEFVSCKKQKTERSPEEKEVKPEMQATGFAAINADNIKLVYLRKSLVEELLKQNESFGDKVVGCFVKVKNDPRDCIAYQILQVTGIKTAENQSEGVHLYVAGMESGVSISKLEDSDIKEEEIKDLKQKVMNGLLRQPTVAEMEQKAKALHEEITKHWITRQLSVLQKRISYANEKGWRRELEEYLEQREVLEKPSEQERLLRETPRIMEEFIEIKKEKAAAASSSQEDVIDIKD